MNITLDLVLGAVAAKGYMAQDTARADLARVGNTAYMRASIAASGGGAVSFTDWNKQVSITAPSSAVNIHTLGG